MWSIDKQTKVEGYKEQIEGYKEYPGRKSNA